MLADSFIREFSDGQWHALVSRGAWWPTLLRSKRELLVENAMFRHQLIVAARKVKRARRPDTGAMSRHGRHPAQQYLIGDGAKSRSYAAVGSADGAPLPRKRQRRIKAVDVFALTGGVAHEGLTARFGTFDLKTIRLRRCRRA